MVKLDLNKILIDNRLTFEDVAKKLEMDPASVRVMVKRGTVKIKTLKKLEESLNKRLDEYIIS